MIITELLDSYGLEMEPLGDKFRILCPFHDEVTASCTVYPETNSFYCFGCHEGGDLVKFISLYEGISIAQVRQRLTSISDLRHRLAYLDKKPTLDYTKETQLLVSKMIYALLKEDPNRLPTILEILKTIDAETPLQFTFAEGMKYVDKVKGQLYKGLEVNHAKP